VAKRFGASMAGALADYALRALPVMR